MTFEHVAGLLSGCSTKDSSATTPPNGSGPTTQITASPEPVPTSPARLVSIAIGFTLGVPLRSSAAASVGYFVASLVLPGILALLAGVREWFLDLQPWIDWNYTQAPLRRRHRHRQRAAMLGSTTAIWIVAPLIIGLLFLRRSEVK